MKRAFAIARLAPSGSPRHSRLARMPRSAIALAFASAAALAACKGGLERMQIQRRGTPYKQTDLFPDDRIMRPPPPGTVPRERELGSIAFTSGMENGKPVQRIPIKVDMALLERGQSRFRIYCAPCHGEIGDGVSPVASNMALRPPPSIHAFRSQPDGFFFKVIREGWGVMPSYSAQLPPHDAWAVVAFVRALQLSQHATIDQAPPDVRRQLQAQQGATGAQP